MPITTRQINTEKRRLTFAILAILEPHLMESGFQGAKIWCPFDKQGLAEPGFMVPDYGRVEAITEDGVADDFYAGGMAVTFYADMSLESLIAIERWAQRRFGV